MGTCKECGCKDGDRGPRGDQGVQGDQGVSGSVGLDGPIGWQGIQGLVGPKGDQGIQGIQGVSGSNVTGPAGPTGAQGTIGIQGIQGAPGVDGTDGINGANGQGRIPWTINTLAAIATISPVANSGLILKNTVGLLTINLPLAALLGDKISFAGTIQGTGGWKLKALGTDTIQMTSQTAFYYETNPGGEVQLGINNYADVIHLVSDGSGKWIIIDAIFANGTTPLFT